jgi:hypothetical protein
MDKLRRALSGDESVDGDDEEQGFAAQVIHYYFNIY